MKTPQKQPEVGLLDQLKSMLSHNTPTVSLKNSGSGLVQKTTRSRFAGIMEHLSFLNPLSGKSQGLTEKQRKATREKWETFHAHQEQYLLLERKRLLEEAAASFREVANSTRKARASDKGLSNEKREQYDHSLRFLGERLQAHAPIGEWVGEDFRYRDSPEQYSFQRVVYGGNLAVLVFKEKETGKELKEKVRIDEPQSIHDKFGQFPLTPDDKVTLEAIRTQATSVEKLKFQAQQEHSWTLLSKCVQQDVKDVMYFWQEKTFVLANGERRVLREVYYDEFGGVDFVFQQGVPVRCEIKNIDALRPLFSELPLTPEDELKEKTQESPEDILPIQELTPVQESPLLDLSEIEIPELTGNEGFITQDMSDGEIEAVVNHAIDRALGVSSIPDESENMHHRLWPEDIIPGPALAPPVTSDRTETVAPASSSRKKQKGKNIALAAALTVGALGLLQQYSTKGKKESKNVPPPQVQINNAVPVVPMAPKIIPPTTYLPEIQKSLDVLGDNNIHKQIKKGDTIWRMMKENGLLRKAWSHWNERVVIIRAKDGKMISPVSDSQARRLRIGDVLVIKSQGDRFDQQEIPSDRRYVPRKQTVGLEKISAEIPKIASEIYVAKVMSETNEKSVKILESCPLQKGNTSSVLVSEKEGKVNEILERLNIHTSTNTLGTLPTIPEIQVDDLPKKIELDIRPPFGGDRIDATSLQIQSQSKRFLQELIERKIDGQEWSGKKIILAQGGKEVVFEKLVYAGGVARIKVHDIGDVQKSFYIRADEPFQSLPAIPAMIDQTNRDINSFASYLEERLSHKKLVNETKSEGKGIFGKIKSWFSA